VRSYKKITSAKRSQSAVRYAIIFLKLRRSDEQRNQGTTNHPKTKTFSESYTMSNAIKEPQTTLKQKTFSESYILP
jgi:hypothetical protein